MSAAHFTLWPACVKTHGFAEQLAAAQAGGFDRLPIGLLTYWALRDEGLSPADIRAMADDHGVSLGHYDGFTAWAPYALPAETPDAARAVFDASADDCLRICDELGLPSIGCTGVYDPAQAETSRLVDAFAAFAQRAGEHGVQVDLEFIPMWAIPDLASAWEIVSGAGSDNAAVMVDSWHFFRGSADLDLLERMPAGSIRTVQLADAPVHPDGTDLFTECLTRRQVPGEGHLPLTRFIDILSRKGGVMDIGPEVFADELDELPAVVAAGRVADGCLRLLQATALDPFAGSQATFAAVPN